MPKLAAAEVRLPEGLAESAIYQRFDSLASRTFLDMDWWVGLSSSTAGLGSGLTSVPLLR